MTAEVPSDPVVAPAMPCVLMRTILSVQCKIAELESVLVPLYSYALCVISIATAVVLTT